MIVNLEHKNGREVEEAISQIADRLTDVEARRIFPEDFYVERAYYQTKSNTDSRYVYRIGGEYCKNNPDNFNPDGSIKYFWIDYVGDIRDFERREEVLESCDELPAEVALRIKRADELAEYQNELQKSNEDRVKKFMKSSSFKKRYQKAIGRIEGRIIPSEVEFAREQLEENKKFLRQKRLKSAQRTRKIAIAEMIDEIDAIKENRWESKEKIGEELDWRLYEHKIDLDDVIQLFGDVIMTEDDAKCVATSWCLLNEITKKDVADDFISDKQVRELFPELDEETDVNKKIAEIVARLYNSNVANLKKRKAEAQAKKIQALRAKKAEIELE